MGADMPFRVELFDDVIDTMRGFDPETQRSLDKVDAVQLLPGREVPLDEASATRAMDALRERFDIDTRRSALFQDLKSGHAPAGIEYRSEEHTSALQSLMRISNAVFCL